MILWVVTVWLAVVVAGEAVRALILFARPAFRESESWNRISRVRWWLYGVLLLVILLNEAAY